MVTYKSEIAYHMRKLADDPKVRFVGYNTKYGPKMHSTLEDCEHACIETPVAENLMCGIAMGLALKGFFPILCFERMDFILASADALINHIGNLQPYGLVLPMIIRIVVGDTTPLDPGIQHRQNYRKLFFEHDYLDTIELHNIKSIYEAYRYRPTKPKVIIEYRGLYGTTN